MSANGFFQDNSPGKVEYRYRYVTVPFQAGFVTGDQLQFYCAGGFFVSLLATGDLILYRQGVEIMVADVTGETRWFNAGGSGAVGFRIKIKKNFMLAIEGRDNYGFRSIGVTPAARSGFPNPGDGFLKTQIASAMLRLYYVI